MNFNAEFSTLMKVLFCPRLYYKIDLFYLHAGKSHAQNSRTDSTPMILTLQLKARKRKNMIAQSVAPSLSKKVP